MADTLKARTTDFEKPRQDEPDVREGRRKSTNITLTKTNEPTKRDPLGQYDRWITEMVVDGAVLTVEDRSQTQVLGVLSKIWDAINP